MSKSDIKGNIIRVTAAPLTMTLRTLLKDPALVPVVFGPAGVGKSSIFNQIASLDFSGNITDTRLGQMQEEDLTGIPETVMVVTDPGDSIFFKGDEIDKKIFWDEWYRCRTNNLAVPKANGVTVYRLPFFFPRKGPAIWFFDEVNRAKKGMLQCIFQLTLDRMYFNYIMPDDVRQAYAGNWSPNDVTYHVEELDPALRSRMCMLYYTGPTYPEWKSWALKNGIKEEVINFLGAHPDLLVTEPKDETPSPNPRTWEKASNVIKASDDLGVRRAALAGYIGLENTIMLLKYIGEQYDPLPDPADLKRAEKVVKGWLDNGQNDRMTAFLGVIVDYVDGGGAYIPSEFASFAKKLPKEFAFTLFNGLFENEKGTKFVREVLAEDEYLYSIIEAAPEEVNA